MGAGSMQIAVLGIDLGKVTRLGFGSWLKNFLVGLFGSVWSVDGTCPRAFGGYLRAQSKLLGGTTQRRYICASWCQQVTGFPCGDGEDGLSHPPRQFEDLRAHSSHASAWRGAVLASALSDMRPPPAKLHHRKPDRIHGKFI